MLKKYFVISSPEGIHLKSQKTGLETFWQFQYFHVPHHLVALHTFRSNSRKQCPPPFKYDKCSFPAVSCKKTNKWIIMKISLALVFSAHGNLYKSKSKSIQTKERDVTSNNTKNSTKHASKIPLSHENRCLRAYPSHLLLQNYKVHTKK